ncbi:stage III sporulation protein AG [Romboutsia sp. Marseille-P6047]|uniref:stage III sporulation protein AG n=1 Tax=Romboutsia sp. Marseille-P6047 TaxID=2161817 RepID=UPI000F04CDD6|nr:stage III sporulation protein AG [Romboutsia sp. Marseille-P6047]
MFKNLNEKDKKKIYSLLSLGIICVLALIIISCIPDNKNISDNNDTSQAQEPNTQEVKSSEEEDLEKKLQKILSKISGAGDVDVMITFESSEEQEPAYNSNTTTETTQEKDSQGGERTVTTESENKTMITSSSNTPIILKTNEAKVKGVIVVSSGATDSKVKETLYSAVQTALQIQGHQVEIYSK